MLSARPSARLCVTLSCYAMLCRAVLRALPAVAYIQAVGTMPSEHARSGLSYRYDTVRYGTGTSYLTVMYRYRVAGTQALYAATLKQSMSPIPSCAQASTTSPHQDPGLQHVLCIPPRATSSLVTSLSNAQHYHVLFWCAAAWHIPSGYPETLGWVPY